MITGKTSASCIFLFPFVSGIILWNFFRFPEEYLLILFIFFGILTLSLSLICRKISFFLLVFFIFITGIFIAGTHGIKHDKNIPIPLQKINAVVGTISDVREKGQILTVVLEDTMVSDGTMWFETGIKIESGLPANEHVYISDRLYLYGIKNIKQTDKKITLTAKSWKVINPDSYLRRFNQNIQEMTEKLVRRWFKYHGQEAAIFKMMVLGNKKHVNEIKQVFIKTGTYHILVVSGLHLGYVLLFLRIIFFPMRKIQQAHYKIFNFIYLAAIVFYSAITGFNTPVLRAALMFGIYILSELIERPISGIESIGWAAAVILFLKPDEIFNMGFQLSFAATTGIVLVMRNIPEIKKIPSWLDSIIRVTIGAQVFATPVLLGNTGYFYPLGFITNFIIIPVGGLAVFLGLAFLVFGFLRLIIIFPLIKTLELFWIGTKIFSGFSPSISWSTDIFLIITIYMIIFTVLFRNRWKIFLGLILLFISAHALIPETSEKNRQLSLRPSSSEETITIFPCRKLLCTVEKENCIILIISEKEDSKTIERAIENLKDKNKEIIFFFTGAAHDVISQLEFLLKNVKPSIIIDNPEIKKNPAFIYRKCFFLSESGIKQDFWKFLKPVEGIRMVYNFNDNQVIEYKYRSGTVILSCYMNSAIFEILPFSPEYHTIYATRLALSNKLVKYLNEYKTGQLLYQKITYNTAKEPLSFRLTQINNSFVIE